VPAGDARANAVERSRVSIRPSLADDIKENGLIYPITVNDDGVLIDGRNRARACEIAGVEPRFEKFSGADPRAFILALNVNRRHMTKGQQAMAHAMIYPEAEKGGRGKKNSVVTTGFSRERLSRARTVLADAADLAQGILNGSVGDLDNGIKLSQPSCKRLASPQPWRCRAKRLVERLRAPRVPTGRPVGGGDPGVRRRWATPG
jgi:hypothetical protein